MAARILVVILNFNGLDDTLDCLKSLHAHPSAERNLLVIDNGSALFDPAPIAARFPEVEVLAIPENLGWAAGNNIGLRLARARGHDFVCLLNNDTVVEREIFADLLAAAAEIGAPCLLSPAIAYFDAPEVWQLHPEPEAHADAAARALAADHDIIRFSWAYGACLLIPTRAIDVVGLFDERFFLQMEEIDYFLRARAHGIDSYCSRGVRILHKESRSFGGRITATKVYYQVRNGLLLGEKHRRSLRGAAYTLREALWALYHKAAEAGAVKGWPGFARWLVSADPMARAARQGAGDYARRRFGRRA